MGIIILMQYITVTDPVESEHMVNNCLTVRQTGFYITTSESLHIITMETSRKWRNHILSPISHPLNASMLTSHQMRSHSQKTNRDVIIILKGSKGWSNITTNMSGNPYISIYNCHRYHQRRRIKIL